MSLNTLTSLAFLKTLVDRRQDHLDCLKPFMLQILIDSRPEPITSSGAKASLRSSFGLEIPERTVQLVLKRVAKDHSIPRADGQYEVPESLPDPELDHKRSVAERHINAVLSGLREFSETRGRPIASEDEGVQCVSSFLAEFGITCLRAYLQGTVIPPVDGDRRSRIVLVSDYVRSLSKEDPERFESFIVLVQGNMLANALLGPDLKGALNSYRKVTFFFDTPLLVELLGHEGEAKQAAMVELLSLLTNLEGAVAVFSHSSEELRRVLLGAADFVDRPDGSGGIVFEARRLGITRSDLLSRAETVVEELEACGLTIIDTPDYVEELQIDETVFEEVLVDEVRHYRNPRAREDDINSVRSIFALRKDKPAVSIEKARAVLVTSNSAFARAAWLYGQQFAAAEDVSSVITDMSLANLAWLKSPMASPDLPRTQVLALAYAAMKPSRRFLDRCLSTFDGLRDRGDITVLEYQVLRSSPFVSRELMQLTLGREEALTKQMVSDTLERASRSMKREELEKFEAEQRAHEQTAIRLKLVETEMRAVRDSAVARCRRNARRLARAVSSCLGLLVVVACALTWALPAVWSSMGWFVPVGGTVLAVLTAGNLLFGTTVREVHGDMEEYLFRRFVAREFARIGVDGGVKVQSEGPALQQDESA